MTRRSENSTLIPVSSNTRRSSQNNQNIEDNPTNASNDEMIQPSHIDGPSSQITTSNTSEVRNLSAPKYSIPKLLGPSNYDSWISIFTAHCARINLRNAFINEDDPLQHELYAEIMFNVSEDIVSCHLVLASTGYEALKILDEAFGHGTMTTHAMLTTLTTIKASTFKSIDDYILKATSLHSALRKSGTEFSQLQLCSFLLNGLDSNNSDITTFKAIHINSLNNQDLTLPFLIRSMKALNISLSNSSYFAGKSNRTTSLRRPCRHCGGKHFDNTCKSPNSKFKSKAKAPISFMASNNPNSSTKTAWILDSGASFHCTGNFHLLSNPLPSNISLQTVNGSCNVSHRGSCTIITTEGIQIYLSEVYFVPTLGTENLLSTKMIVQNGGTISMKNDCASIELPDKRKIHLQSNGNLFYLKTSPIHSTINSSFAAIATPKTKIKIPTKNISDWHTIFGHRNTKTINQTSSDNTFIISNSNSKTTDCTACILSKTTFPPRHSNPIRSNPKPHEHISCDIKGPYSMHCDNFKYDLKILDHGSDYSSVYLLKQKSDATQYIINYINQLYNNGHNLLFYQSDGALELCGKPISDLAANKGFTIITSTPHCHTDNGKIERLHRTLANSMNAQLIQSNLPPNFWGYSLLTANYTRNLLYSQVSRNIPHKLFWPNVSPRYDNLQPFGCLCYIHFPDSKQIKSPGPKNFPGLFLGYGNDTNDKQFKGHRFLSLSTDDNRIKFSSFISYPSTTSFPGLSPTTFDTTPLNYTHQLSSNSLSSNSNNDVLTPPIKNNLLAGPIESSNILTGKRNRNPVSFQALLASAISFGPLDPKNTREAHASAEAAEWKQAEEIEFNNLKDHKTFRLVPPNSSYNPIGCKMVYKTKFSADGSISKRKCRLVAHGFSQKPGIDFNETYAPTLKSKSLRIILAIAASRSMKTLSMDISSAFLYPPLTKPIAMKQPPGLEIKHKEDWIYLLDYCLYGLRQSSYEFNNLLVTYLKELGFNQLSVCADACVFRKSNGKSLTILLEYVDDFAIFCDRETDLKSIENALLKRFKMTSSPLSWFLGMEITSNLKEIAINQSLYISKLLSTFNLNNMIPAKTPIAKSYALSIDDSESFQDQSKFRSLLGSIIYVATQTRFDIMFAVSRIASKASNPTINDYNALLRVCQYLKHTMNHKLIFFKGQNLILKGYSDSDHAEDKETRKSTTGSIWTICSTPISWFSKRQDLITNSSTESELVAAHFTAHEGIWINRILMELQIKETYAIELYIDNQSTISIIAGSRINQRTKHIDLKYMKIRELFHEGKLLVKHIPTEDNIADIGTKSLNATRIEYLNNLAHLRRE